MKSKTGETAFSRASQKSVNIAKFIMSRNVNVATIDSSFLTPQFVHEELVLEMLLAGINPKGKDFLTYVIYDQTLCYSKMYLPFSESMSDSKGLFSYTTPHTDLYKTSFLKSFPCLSTSGDS